MLELTPFSFSKITMKTILSFVVILFSTSAFASGYGWYVQSFNWEVYQKSQTKIQGQYLEIAKKLQPELMGINALQGKFLEIAKKRQSELTGANAQIRMRESHFDMATQIAFYGCCEPDTPSTKPSINIKPIVKLIEEPMPDGLEFFRPDAFQYAAEKVPMLKYAAKRVLPSVGTTNYFEFFGYGRSYADGKALKECISGWGSGGYCMEASFVLSPNEINQFYAQVVDLNSFAKHPNDFKPNLVHLEKVLQKYRNGKRGLLFEGHD